MTHAHQTAIVVLTAVIFSFDNLREKRLQPSTSQSRTACLKNSYSTQRLKITNVVTSPRPQQTHTFFLSPRPKPLCTCSDKQNLIWDPQGITLNPGRGGQLAVRSRSAAVVGVAHSAYATRRWRWLLCRATVRHRLSAAWLLETVTTVGLSTDLSPSGSQVGCAMRRSKADVERYIASVQGFAPSPREVSASWRVGWLPPRPGPDPAWRPPQGSGRPPLPGTFW